MEKEYKSEMNYNKLIVIIKNYYLNKKGIKLSFPSSDYLKDKLTEKNSMNPSPFFSMQNELGTTHFDLSKEEIEIILKEYLKENNYEYIDVNYDRNVEITYKINEKNNINEETINTEKIDNKEYNSKMEYNSLVSIIVNYYKTTKNIDLRYASTIYLKDKLTKRNNMNSSPFFLMQNELGETKFDISPEEINEILTNYAEINNFEFKDVSYNDKVEVTYIIKKQNISNKITQENEPPIIDNNEVITPVDNSNLGLKLDVQSTSINQDTDIEEKENPILNNESSLDTKEEKEPNYERAILANQLSERSFKLKQIKNQIDDNKRKTRVAAIMTAIFGAGAMAATYYSGMDTEAAIQAEISAVNSWEAFKEYLSYITPAITLTLVGFVSSLDKYIKDKKAYKKALIEQENLLASNPINYLNDADELGRTR